MNKVIFCLFDGSGIMGLPWAEAGHTVYCFNSDSGNHGEYVVKMNHPNIHYVNIWIDSTFEDVILYYPKPDFIFAFPDCTMFAGSGEKHERSDEDIQQALNSAKLVEYIANKYSVPWFVENPVGKLSTLWRKPNFYFDPYQFGGYMTEADKPFHSKMPAYDGYTKKTCIWHGNGFIKPWSKPGPVNIGMFWGWAYLGGKSAKTKQLRSLTPRGFARAVYLANRNVIG